MFIICKFILLIFFLYFFFNYYKLLKLIYFLNFVVTLLFCFVLFSLYPHTDTIKHKNIIINKSSNRLRELSVGWLVGWMVACLAMNCTNANHKLLRLTKKSTQRESERNREVKKSPTNTQIKINSATKTTIAKNYTG